jgi:ATP-dependent DNA helicase RecG
MAERLGVSRQTIAARIKVLKEKKILRREGSDTKGYWEIIRD